MYVPTQRVGSVICKVRWINIFVWVYKRYVSTHSRSVSSRGEIASTVHPPAFQAARALFLRQIPLDLASLKVKRLKRGCFFKLLWLQHSPRACLLGGSCGALSASVTPVSITELGVKYYCSAPSWLEWGEIIVRHNNKNRTSVNCWLPSNNIILFYFFWTTILGQTVARHSVW